MLTQIPDRKMLVGAILMGLLLAMVGCAQQDPYIPGYSFYPQPATVNVMHRGPTEETPLTTLASVTGVRRADPEKNQGPAVVVRLQFQNNGATPVTFDPGTLELVNGELRPFPPPQVQPPHIIDILPGQRQEVTAAFPLPSGSDPQQMSLRNLRLRWQVKLDNYSIPQSALFEQGTGNANAYQQEERPREAY
jgi:hypothetical protein